MDTANSTPHGEPRFIKWILIIAIAIVANLFISYAISLVYKEPVWNDFCPSQQINEPMTKDQCVSRGGQWNGVIKSVDGVAPVSSIQLDGYCDVNYTCQKDYDAARSAFERNVFVTLVVFGVLLIALGLFMKNNGVLKTALASSGTLSLVVASFRYWGEAHDWLKVVILGVALAALIYLAIKKFSKS